MTPGARVAAAIEILDEIAGGAPAEATLTRWARARRFAGSKDRAAIRDHVYDVLRRWDSTAIAGGAATGRARMIGLLRLTGHSPPDYFTGEGHAPEPLAADETQGDLAAAEACADLPDWIVNSFISDLGGDAHAVVQLLKSRAPVFLRVNLRRARVTDPLGDAINQLADDGIEAEPHPNVETALRVTSNPRRVAQSRAYQEGLIELQDASAQAAALAVPIGDSVLDYCAGGGGKVLALAARRDASDNVRFHAYDVSAARMRDIPTRAERAGVHVTVHASLDPTAAFDTVLVDAPCSGSGTWRRTPEAKWRLTEEALAGYERQQAQILEQAAAHVRSGGHLCYMTCSVFDAENEHVVNQFLSDQADYSGLHVGRILPSDQGDGFFWAIMKRVDRP